MVSTFLIAINSLIFWVMISMQITPSLTTPTPSAKTKRSTANNALTTQQLIQSLVNLNGPMNGNKFDAYVVYNMTQVNEIYATTYKTTAMPLPPFEAVYNITNGTVINGPLLWRSYNVYMTFYNPVYSFDINGDMIVTQTLTPDSYYNETNYYQGYGPSVTNQSLNGALFTLTCPLVKMKTDIMGDIVSLNLTDSSMQINLPALSGTDFLVDFANYWKEGNKSEVYVLGKVTNENAGYRSLTPYSFEVCTIAAPSLESGFIVLAINTLISNKTVDLNGVSCYDLFPNNLSELMIPQDHSVSLYLSPKNMGVFLQDILANTFGFSNFTMNNNSGIFSSMTSPHLYDATYLPSSDCYAKDISGTPNSECAKKSKKYQTYPVKPTFKQDLTKQGNAQYTFAYQEAHTDVYVCSENYQTYDIQWAACGLCYYHKGNEVKSYSPVFYSNANLNISFKATDDDLNVTIDFSTSWSSLPHPCQTTSKQSSQMSGTTAGASKSVTSNSQVISEEVQATMNLFRLSNLLFPECHVMAFQDAAHTPNFAIFGNIITNPSCDDNIGSVSKGFSLKKIAKIKGWIN